MALKSDTTARVVDAGTAGMTVEVAPGDVRPLRFDLRNPCGECPFRLDVPLHQGVGVDLATKTGWALVDGTFSHTCHRTDPRSDYRAAKDFKGPLQHCAGAMIMLAKQSPRDLPGIMAKAKDRGWLNVRKLNLKAPVYTLPGMLKAYHAWFVERGSNGP